MDTLTRSRLLCDHLIGTWDNPDGVCCERFASTNVTFYSGTGSGYSQVVRVCDAHLLDLLRDWKAAGWRSGLIEAR